MGGILILGGCGQGQSDPLVWRQVRVGMTSEVLVHVRFGATHHFPASSWGDLTKALDQPAGLRELCASPTHQHQPGAG